MHNKHQRINYRIATSCEKQSVTMPAHRLENVKQCCVTRDAEWRTDHGDETSRRAYAQSQRHFVHCNWMCNEAQECRRGKVKGRCVPSQAASALGSRTNPLSATIRTHRHHSLQRRTTCDITYAPPAISDFARIRKKYRKIISNTTTIE